MGVGEIISFLREKPGARVALSGHARPDADSLGACFALADILLSRGYRAILPNPGFIQEKFHFLIRRELIVETVDSRWWNDQDIMGVIDCGEISRLPDANRDAASALPVFNIDHHVSSPGVGRAIWIESSASSSSEMIFRLARAAGWSLSPSAAQSLWTGIVADTGRFSQENVTPESLEAALGCLLAGASPVLTDTNLFQSVGQGERRLQGRMLDRLDMLAGGRLAASWVGMDDFREFELEPAGSYDLINLLRGIVGVEAAILFSDVGAGIKVSVRTKGPHDAARIMARFDGGGHARAAGCSIRKSLEEAWRLVLSSVLDDFFPETEAGVIPDISVPAANCNQTDGKGNAPGIRNRIRGSESLLRPPRSPI
ncbi:MAG: DHH family phosphoesterase [Planctomycetota bacterium]|jgi:phosphoesterase RecJ-like protein|nr:DHH family phosphoesterase [Planctomycetota bacterium]